MLVRRPSCPLIVLSKTMCPREVSVKMQPLLVCPVASWRAMVCFSRLAVDRLWQPFATSCCHSKRMSEPETKTPHVWGGPLFGPAWLAESPILPPVLPVRCRKLESRRWWLDLVCAAKKQVLEPCWRCRSFWARLSFRCIAGRVQLSEKVFVHVCSVSGFRDRAILTDIRACLLPSNQHILEKQMS